MNAMTDTGVKTEDRMFANIDSTVRQSEIGHYEVLMSDTVGFIRKLPHDLIDRFKSTLNEVREADILLPEVDSSALMIEDYIEVVDDTLEDMDAAENKKTLLGFNKIDGIEPERIE